MFTISLAVTKWTKSPRRLHSFKSCCKNVLIGGPYMVFLSRGSIPWQCSLMKIQSGRPTTWIAARRHNRSRWSEGGRLPISAEFSIRGSRDARPLRAKSSPKGPSTIKGNSSPGNGAVGRSRNQGTPECYRKEISRKGAKAQRQRSKERRNTDEHR